MRIINDVLYKVYREDIENGTFKIPSSVKSIEVGAFCGCRNLKTIGIPSSVTSIGRSAFHSCSNLKTIEIPSSVTSIGDYAFCCCINLKKLGKFKATDGNMKCRDFQYELGKWYEEPEAALCEKGFHYCENAFDLFNYYSGEIGKDVRFFEVETEDVSYECEDDSKRVCKRIKLVREIKSYAELLN